MIPSLKKHKALAPEVVRYNGGQRCDMETGPCACGAWHEAEPALFDVGTPKPAPPIEEEFVLPPEPEPDRTQKMVFDPPLSGAEFSECRLWRYTLWRRFKMVGPTIVACGLNPSKAGEVDNDNTVTRVCNFAKREGAAIVWMTNVIPYCETSPKKMRAAIKAMGEEEYEKHAKINYAKVLEVASKADRVIMCCGNGGEFMGAAQMMIDHLQLACIDLECFGLTKLGFCRHPLYLRGDTKIVPFDAAEEEFFD